MNWNSPYQTQAYTDCLAALGIPVLVQEGTPKIHYNALTTEQLTGWETNVDVTGLSLESTVYNFSGLHHLAKVQWTDTDYFTLAIDLEQGLSLTNARRRNIRKAARSGVEYFNTFSEEGLKLFMENPPFRANMSETAFKDLAQQLIGACADYHEVRFEDQPIASAVVLRSNSVANIRFVASTEIARSLQAVSLLYEQIIQYYKTRGYSFVDLSGIAHPNASQKLKNINSFKTGFTQIVGVFTQHA